MFKSYPIAFYSLILMFYKMLYEKIGHLRPISDKKAKQRYCTVDQGRDGFRERGVLGHLSFGGPKHM